MWIGASGTASDSTSWTWGISGDVIADWSYDNWYSSARPIANDPRDCVKFKDGREGGWDNTACSNTMTYACQKSAVSCSATSTTTTTSTSTTSTTSTSTTTSTTT